MFEKNVLKETILERYLPDYPAMLLVPKEIEDFEKFRSEFRCIAEVLKQSNERKQAIEKTLKRDGHYKHISREAVAIINEFAGMHIKMREGGNRDGYVQGLERKYGIRDSDRSGAGSQPD